jgi:hypothetical protein
MAASDTSGLIYAALISGGFVVASQVVTTLTDGRREKNRIKRDETRTSRELQQHHDERFLDIKRDLYSSFANQISNLMGHIRSHTDPTVPYTAHLDMEELRRLQWTIDIIARQPLGKSVADSLQAFLAAKEAAESNKVPHARKVELEEK